MAPSSTPLRAIGLMSGTSMDGVDAAMIVTDGERVLEFGPHVTLPYDDLFRETIRLALGTQGTPELTREITFRHAAAVEEILHLSGQTCDVVGFHGHTLFHRPEQRTTFQAGDGDLLAQLCGIPVVADFRSQDVEAGGQGAPLVPLFHAALAHGLEKPLAVLNLGGVGNVTWMGGDGSLLAFDTGPGNALIDDWVLSETGRPMDEDGRLALTGQVDALLLAEWLTHPYFRQPPPKSLDRDDFKNVMAGLRERGLGPADGAATLVGLTAGAVARALEWLPEAPTRWLVTGGGRANQAIMQALEQGLETSLLPVEVVGWQGDALEAQAFAFLAVRSLKGLPLSLPGTTGVPRPMPGGRLHQAASASLRSR